MITNLVEITRWAHTAIAECVTPGDLVVDLTVGNGKDTLFLRNAVGPEGCVAGFDIQTEALEKAEALLRSSGASAEIYSETLKPLSRAPGVHLFCADHANWAEFVPGSPTAVIANLGYLPGGDHSIVTQRASTLAALRAALNKLSPKGRLAVVCYVEHQGGREEAEGVEQLFSQETDGFHVLRMSNPKADNAPFLLVAEKIRET